MKKTVRLLALAFALVLMPAFAAAQTFPTVPANTVIGRLGIGTGPAQAIPFAQLSQYMFGQIPNNTAIGNVSGSSAFPSGLTATQLTTLCNAFTSSLKGCVPASGGGTTNFLRADGTWSSQSVTAGNVTYTPQGLGGVATTAKALLDRTIWVNDYGAACNGVTNDATAFQNAINEGQSLGLPVRFTGTCVITSGLSITAALDFGGVNSGVNGTQSRIAVGSAGAIGITITTPVSVPVYLHDFGMIYSSPASGGVAAITVTGTSSNENTGSKFERLTLNGNINVGISFVKASNWTLTNSTIVAANTAVLVQNQNVADSGDSTIYGSLLQAASGGTGLLWNSSGGLRFENNKILGTTMNTGINISLASGASTADIFIVGNSIEGIGNSSPAIALSRQGTTGGVTHVLISNNELAGGNVCVSVPTDATGVWLTNLVITGNGCQSVNATTAFGFIVGNSTVQGLVISNNAIYFPGAGTNQPLNIGTGMSATNCVVGPNTRVGTTSASANGSCTVITPN